jgi:AcrR family transcriptional regulator
MGTRPRPAPRGRRRAVGESDARERILIAALEIFAERGFEGATTRDIAARAATNLGLIQYYFRGKERLWRAAVERVFAALETALEQVVPERLETREQLAEIIRVGVRFVAANPSFVRLMNDECKREGARMRWLVDGHGRRLYDTAVAVFEHGRQRGLLPDVPAPHAYYVFIGAAGMIFSQAPECRRLTGTDPTTSPAMIEAHGEALVRLFVRSAPARR